jgi:DNA-binding transcriptional MerR regulator
VNGDREGIVVEMDQGYSGSQAASIVGISYRQLDYWTRTDLVRPGVSEAQGSGSRRFFSYRNLLELRMVKSLLDAGIRLEAIREVFRFLRSNSDEEISSAHLVISGSSVVLCRGEDLVDVVRNGQGVLNLLPLAQVKEQVDGRLVDVFTRPSDPMEHEERTVTSSTRRVG